MNSELFSPKSRDRASIGDALRLGERAYRKKKKKNHGNELDVNQVLTLYIYIYIYISNKQTNPLYYCVSANVANDAFDVHLIYHSHKFFYHSYKTNGRKGIEIKL